MKSWRPLLVIAIGLAAAAGALFSVTARGCGAPLDEIDDSSRASLERVLREADRDASDERAP